MMEETDVLLALVLACDERAPGRVREALAALGREDWIIGDVMLVASELVTNAVRHSGAGPDEELEVRVCQSDARLVVSVRDPGTAGGVAAIAEAPVAGFGGLGLRIVGQLASRWGQARGEGYCVWAELMP